MRTKIALITALSALGALVPAAALAQEAPPTPAPGTPGDPPTAAPGAAAVAPPPAVDETTAPAAAPEPAEPAAGPEPIPGWVRIDSDGGGVQLWGGGTFPLTDSLGLAFDMYVFQGAESLGEFDIGPAITAGPFTLTPMVGFQANWSTRRAQAIVPQFYATGGPDPLYVELWLQYYMNKVFNDQASNQVYGRLIVDYKLSDYVALGVEADMGFDSAGVPNSDGEVKKLNSLPVGVNVLLSNVGAASSFMGFLGYETLDPGANDNHLAGRLTFIHNF